jgi:hypothetical protein
MDCTMMIDGQHISNWTIMHDDDLKPYCTVAKADTGKHFFAIAKKRNSDIVLGYCTLY